MIIDFDSCIPNEKYNRKFYLKNHGDTQYIQFVDPELKNYHCESIHRVQRSSKHIHFVGCLGDDCILCQHTSDRISKTKYICYIPIYNFYADRIQIWERPLSWAKESLVRILEDLGPDKFINTVFAVQRMGNRNDPNTHYIFYPQNIKPRKLNHKWELQRFQYDYPVHHWTAAQQSEFISTNKLPFEE